MKEEKSKNWFQTNKWIYSHFFNLSDIFSIQYIYSTAVQIHRKDQIKSGPVILHRDKLIFCHWPGWRSGHKLLTETLSKSGRQTKQLCHSITPDFLVQNFSKLNGNKLLKRADVFALQWRWRMLSFYFQLSSFWTRSLIESKQSHTHYTFFPFCKKSGVCKPQVLDQ